jgi:hypothetical protein
MNRYRMARLILWMTAFVAFHMAWTAHDTAAFTLNAFDLAEQVSIHPGIRAESPPLRTSLFLWSAIPLIAAGIALSAARFENRYLRWGLYALAGLVSLRVIPPEVALRSPRQLMDSPHDRTLAILTALGLVAVCVMILLGKRIQRYGWMVEAGLCITALLLPCLGWERSLRLLDELQVNVTVGGGAMIYMAVVLATLVMVVLTRLSTHDPGLRSSARVAVKNPQR